MNIVGGGGLIRREMTFWEDVDTLQRPEISGCGGGDRNDPSSP